MRQGYDGDALALGFIGATIGLIVLVLIVGGITALISNFGLPGVGFVVGIIAWFYFVVPIIYKKVK